MQLDHRFGNAWTARLATPTSRTATTRSSARPAAVLPDPETGAGMSLWAGRYQEQRTQVQRNRCALDHRRRATRVVERAFDVESDWAGITDESYDEDDPMPFLGLIYDMGANHSVYASYTGIFKPPTVRNRNNESSSPKRD